MNLSISQDLHDALTIDRQPDGLRDCHDRLVDWVRLFRQPVPFAQAGEGIELSPEALRRLSYLVGASRMIGGLELGPGWDRIEDEGLAVAQSLKDKKPWEPVWACDPEPNPLDGVAELWGFSRGVRFATLKQIVRTGGF